PGVERCDQAFSGVGSDKDAGVNRAIAGDYGKVDTGGAKLTKKLRSVRREHRRVDEVRLRRQASDLRHLHIEVGGTVSELLVGNDGAAPMLEGVDEVVGQLGEIRVVGRGQYVGG